MAARPRPRLRRKLFSATFVAASSVALALAAPAGAANGTWDRAWGENVDSVAPGAGFEICTVAANCQIGGTDALGGELNSPNGLATDSSGNVYVADSSHHRIQKFDSSGNFLMAWGEDVVNTGVDNVGTTSFERCIAGTNDVCKTGISTEKFGGDMSAPAGVAVDSSDNVYVADQNNNRIQKFSSSGIWALAWGEDVDLGGVSGFETCTSAGSCKAGTHGAPEEGGELFGPNGVATDSLDNVYVADQSNQRIQKFSSSGVWNRAWGENVDNTGGSGFEICTVDTNCQIGDNVPPSPGGEMNFPWGVATDSSNNVYVADEVNKRIQKFNSSGTFLRAWGKDVVLTGPDDSGAANGFEICIDPVDTCQPGNSSTGLGGELNFPSGIAVDSSGNVYVAELSNNRIQRFDSSGNWQRAWGKGVNGGASFEICTVASMCAGGAASSGTLGGEMNFPEGLATDAAGALYLVDNTNNRVQKFADPVTPPSSGGGGGSTPATTPATLPPATGLRAAALHKCKHKHGRARTLCKKRANRLPI